MVGEVHVPVGAALGVEFAVPGDLRAHRELQEQGVEQVDRLLLVVLGRRLEDRAE